MYNETAEHVLQSSFGIFKLNRYREVIFGCPSVWSPILLEQFQNRFGFEIEHGKRSVCFHKSEAPFQHLETSTYIY